MDAKIIPGEFGWKATGLIWRGFVVVMAFELARCICSASCPLDDFNTASYPPINANTHINVQRYASYFNLTTLSVLQYYFMQSFSMSSFPGAP